MAKNLRNVALPGTGLALSVRGSPALLHTLPSVPTSICVTVR